MANKEKIRLMAKAAQYEESDFRHDSFAARYFKGDYIDKAQLTARIWATIFFILYWAYRLVKEFYVEGANLLTYPYVGTFVKIIVSFIGLLLVVSWIAGFAHARRYDQAKKRIDEYYDLLDQISEYD